MVLANFLSWIICRFVLGSDVADEVVEVGREVTGHNIGDHALGYANAIDAKSNGAAEGAFQTYSVVEMHMAPPVPRSMTYESAAVPPLGVSTSACGMVQEHQLGLLHPFIAP